MTGTDDPAMVGADTRPRAHSAEGRLARATASDGAPGGSSMTDLLRYARDAATVDIALGIPDSPPPPRVLEAAREAIASGHNQYIDSNGLPALRARCAEWLARQTGAAIDPGAEMTVTVGATGGVFCALAALAPLGDEVVVFDPCFPQHTATARLLGCRVRTVPCHPPDWSFDRRALLEVMSDRTRAVLVSSPGNPTGKVFSLDDLAYIAAACHACGAMLIVDEIYADFVYEGRPVSALELPGARDRVIVVRGLAKAQVLSGWRIGFVVASAAVSARIRAVNDCSTLGAATPLQYGALGAFTEGSARLDALRARFERQRASLSDAFRAHGCVVSSAAGGIFQLVGTPGEMDGQDFARALHRACGVLVAPGAMFGEQSRRFVRVCFGRSSPIHDAAVERLLGGAVSPAAGARGAWADEA